MSPQLLGTPQDEQAIRSAGAEFAAAWNRNDVKALAGCFADDGDLINLAGRVGRGRSEVEKILNVEQNGPFKGSRLSMPQRHLRFIKPDLAIAGYGFQISQIRGEDGKEMAMKGLVTAVLRKDGGRWLIIACRPMIPAPLPGGRNSGERN